MSEQPDSNQEKRSAIDIIYDGIGALLPGCSTAMDLVEKGMERPLTLKERFTLAYNSPLCLHCNCNRERFDIQREKLRLLDQKRRES